MTRFQIPSLGGKLGKKIASLGCQTGGDAVALSLAQLGSVMSESSAKYAYRRVRGVDDSVVAPKGGCHRMGWATGRRCGCSLSAVSLCPIGPLPPSFPPFRFIRARPSRFAGPPKSLMSSQSFTATSDVSLVEDRLLALATEMSQRLAVDADAFNRVPKNFHVYFSFLDKTFVSVRLPL